MGTIALRLRELRRSWSLDHGKKGAPVWARPAVEALEDRLVLDALTLTWIGDPNGLWSNKDNWSHVPGLRAPRPPQNGDSLIFNQTSIENGTNDIVDLAVKSLTVTSQYSGQDKGEISLQQDLTVTHTVSIAGGFIGGTGPKTLKLYNPDDMDNTPSSFTWSGGILDVSVEVSLGASEAIPTLSIEGTANKTFSGQQFVSDANATWTGGDIILTPGAEFMNGGTFDVRVDKSIKAVNYDPDFPSVFTNSGTFKKTVATGTTTIEIDFRNHEAVQFSSGTVAFTHDFDQAFGTTTLNGGNVQTAEGFWISAGTLEGVGTITGSVTNWGGNVIPGLNGGPGTLNITGDYDQNSGGTLTINVNATGGYGVLNVQGTANLAGHLQVNNDPAWQPALADLVFLHYDSFTGDFDTWEVSNNYWETGGSAYMFLPFWESDGYHLRTEEIG